jgi:hypothetical protein
MKEARDKEIENLGEIEFAVLEPGGKKAFIKKSPSTLDLHVSRREAPGSGFVSARWAKGLVVNLFSIPGIRREVRMLRRHLMWLTRAFAASA